MTYGPIDLIALKFKGNKFKGDGLKALNDLMKKKIVRVIDLVIISKNKEMRRLFGILEQVSDSDATILLEGERRTGKELFAKAIHALSPRKTGPLITINCGSLPDTLLESELFGYPAVLAEM